jgi:hypothetical protein
MRASGIYKKLAACAALPKAAQLVTQKPKKNRY